MHNIKIWITFKYNIVLLNIYTFFNNYNLLHFLVDSKLVKLHILNNYSLKQCISS